MAEAIGGSECTMKNTCWLSHRSFSKYTGPPFIAIAIFAIFAQGNSPNFATALEDTRYASGDLHTLITYHVLGLVFYFSFFLKPVF